MRVTFSYIAPHIELTAQVLRAGVRYADVTANVTIVVKKLAWDFTDAINAVDQAVIQFTKALADSITATDERITAYTKALSDSIAATDTFTISNTKALAEVMTANDTGRLCVQDYAADYFYDDYVGAARSF